MPQFPGFQVGPVRVDPPLLLAPMEDVTNQPFRRIAKRIGRPGLVFTEFVSAMAVHHNAQKTIKKMLIHEEERPLGIQIFGGDVDTMVETARVAEEAGADLVDINMGCWVPKVCKTGAGAALLKDPELAEKIVGAVVKAVEVPVTVKVRAGWDYSLFAAPDLARRFEAAGAQMLTLHARFAKQGFEGEADWRLVGQLREAVRIPLVGNGDVKTAEDAAHLMRSTGADGVMVGRAAISNPWALARIRCGLTGETAMGEPKLAERIDTALLHLRWMIECEVGAADWQEALASPRYADAELWASRHLRGQIPLYIKGEWGAAALREKLTRCSSYAEVESNLREFEARATAEHARSRTAQ